MGYILLRHISHIGTTSCFIDNHGNGQRMKRHGKSKKIDEIDFNSVHWQDSDDILDPFSDEPIIDPVERFRRWHWGKAPTHIIEIDDERFPDHNIEIGRLMEITVELLDEDDNRSNPVDRLGLEIDEKSVNECHIMFDHAHSKDRIYVDLNKETQDDFAQLYEQLDHEPIDLNELASMTEGIHSDMNDYPTVLVKPLGYITDVCYYTHKNGDDDGIGSGYHHEMGEETGIQPILAVAEDGTIWFAGGDYTCPNAGITN
jgi:hypothetical protein